jgi:uncharacterized damage-inducible protein DinB
MDVLQMLRIAARANLMANRRLHAAMAPLSREEFHAPRTSFFPSLARTLNHLLAIDTYYIDALEGAGGMAERYEAYTPADTVADLAERQRASDERLVGFVDRLRDADVPVAMDRGGGQVQHDVAGHVLAHLYMHQTHHRGQAHAMLAGTAVKPPQLDEFLMPSDAPLREADMRAMGWTETAIYGRPGRPA